MPNRTAKFVSAVFASLLAGTPLATVSHGATPVADDCLSGPKDQAPQGGHWYYHIDRATKRHCWYLKDEREKLSQIAAPNSSASAKPVLSKTEPAMQGSIADAHAELPMPQTHFEPETSVATGQRTPAPAAKAAGPENNQGANAPDVNTQQSMVASRWPDPTDLSSSAGPEPATDNSGAPVPSDAGAALSPAVAAVTLAAADSSEKSESPSGSIRMLLLVIIGALSLAGLMGSAIFRFGGARWTGRRQIRGDRRAIWDSASTDRPSSPAYAGPGTRMRQVDFPRELRTADDPDRRIAEMLAQLSRSRKA
jgi:hypothetical protein